MAILLLGNQECLFAKRHTGTVKMGRWFWVSVVGLFNDVLIYRPHFGRIERTAYKKNHRVNFIGITILTGFSFITECFWKAENMCKMNHFFTMSGYSLWFLYFIMIAEGLGGLGVLLHFKLKTGPVSAAGLMLIMIGALYTHCHNKDPFSESYPAIEQFMMLGLMQVIYYFEQLAQPRPMSFSLTDQ
jgi:uncharacterized membrane protein YphA (DoxX/SURF4 family)